MVHTDGHRKGGGLCRGDKHYLWTRKHSSFADYLRGLLSITELCQLYGVNRKTAYKWIERYLRHGRPLTPSSEKGRLRRAHTRLFRRVVFKAMSAPFDHMTVPFSTRNDSPRQGKGRDHSVSRSISRISVSSTWSSRMIARSRSLNVGRMTWGGCPGEGFRQ